ncbi:MAG TPA: Xaa-Pro peptidase family protein [Candidatus Binatia bacterium]|nr:Xaa-Pro peptidase family protein [Candidatus Binatia bacterium]
MTEVAARPAISTDRYRERLAAAGRIVERRELAALLVGVGPDLRHLTGYDAMPLERLTMLVLPARGRPTLIAPRLEGTPARGCPAATGGLVAVRTWEETESPHALVAELVRESAALGSPAELLGVAVSDTLWASHVLRLQEMLPGSFELGSTVTRELRIVKDAEEIELLRLAAHAADRVVDAIAAGRLVGRTEAEVSREVRDRLVAEGHDRAEFAIVASGPNSSSPHHEASDRVIGPGEPIVLDIGGTIEGYGSDITRMVWVTGPEGRGPSDEYRRAFEVLHRAQATATAAVRPGVTAEAIDAAARQVISAAGFGERFIHRTGHGIGLEAHEDPYIVTGDREALRSGMAFSIEPGIYVDGAWGMRLEDIVVCGPTGADVLNRADRSLRVVVGT